MKPVEDKPFEFLSSSRPESSGGARDAAGRRSEDRPFEFLETNVPVIDEAPPREFDFAQIASRYKWFLAIGLIGGLALGHAAFLKLGPEYDAVAQILVTRQAQVPVRESLSQEIGRAHV